MKTVMYELLTLRLVRECSLQLALMDVLRVHRESWGTEATLLKLRPGLRIPLLQEICKETGIPLPALLTSRLQIGVVPVLVGHLIDPDAYVEVYGNGASQFKSI